MDSNPHTTPPLPVQCPTWWLSLICFILVQLLLHWYLLFEFPASALSLRSADKVGRPFCCCIVFSLLFFIIFFSFPLTAFCDFSAIFYRISLIFDQLVDNNLVEELYTFGGYEGQRSRSQGDTRWKCLFSNFSVIYHPIVFKFSWLIVLDKKTTWCKFQGRGLKVKVTRRQPWKISCTLISLLFLNEFSVKLGWYIASISSINPMNFQIRTPNVMVTVRQNISSIHPTYFCSSRQ